LRAGGAIPKQYTLLGGVPLIRRTIEIFLKYKDENGKAFSSVILVINPADEILCRKTLGDISAQIQFINGGSTRQESTLNGLHFLKKLPQSPDFIYIHDGARPFVSKVLLDRIRAALTAENGVLPALPVAETLKRTDAHGFVTETVPRSELYAAQTPQAFPFAAILRAHESAIIEGRNNFTDDSALAEHCGLPVKLVEGSRENIKITWAEDIKMAEKILMPDKTEQNSTLPFPDIRTGNGYDVHKLISGDGVTLCGIKIPCPFKLLGHSDADVALHALTDALLATCGAGDIGTYFPPSDPQWENAESSIFLRHAVELVQQKGGRIINADITLICEMPKIMPHREAMTANLQTLLELEAERVSVKATTNEMLGFIGRREGIAAIATANVFYR